MFLKGPVFLKSFKIDENSYKEDLEFYQDI